MRLRSLDELPERDVGVSAAEPATPASVVYSASTAGSERPWRRRTDADRRRPDRPSIGAYGESIRPGGNVRKGVSRSAKHVVRTGAVATASVRELPDFLIIGTKRGGTTSLYNYMLKHPDVMPLLPARQKLKGLYFFDVNHERGDRWYRSHFMSRNARRLAERKRGHRVLLGESTPYYLYHPHAPRRAAELVPDVRVIMLLRDPVERAYSHYKERVRQGVETLAFDEAIAAEPRRLDGEEARMIADPRYRSFAHQMFSYADQGRYLDGVRRWQQSYPDNQLLILRSEDLYAEPKQIVDEVQAFLGLPSVELDSYKAWNQKPAKDMDTSVRSELTQLLSPDVDQFESHLGRDFNWF